MFTKPTSYSNSDLAVEISRFLIYNLAKNNVLKHEQLFTIHQSFAALFNDGLQSRDLLY